jgi:hypothetical protein
MKIVGIIMKIAEGSVHRRVSYRMAGRTKHGCVSFNGNVA